MLEGGKWENIFAFTDSWISSVPKYKCLHKPLDLQKMSVSNFIFPSGNWNEGLLRQHFLVIEADAIHNISLNMIGSEDIIILDGKFEWQIQLNSVTIGSPIVSLLFIINLSIT